MSELPLPNLPPDYFKRHYGQVARAIAGGLVRDQHGRPQFARVTLTFQPTSETAVDALAAWPDILKFFFSKGPGYTYGNEIDILLAPFGSDASSKTVKRTAKLEWAPPTSDVAARIVDFWQRMMAPPSPHSLSRKTSWEDLIEVLRCATKKKAELPDLILPTPHAEAALAFTLERGRLVLDALAEPGAQLLDRPSSDDFVLGANRPWFGDGPQPLQFAYNNSASVLSDAEGDKAGAIGQDWLSPYRAATKAGLQAKKVAAIWPDPQTFARKALGRNGGLSDLIDKIHAAHHHATPVATAHLDCKTEEELLDTARRRYGALLAHPVLQRLVGLAADVLIPIEFLTDLQKSFERAADNSCFLKLSLVGADQCWTLARFSPAGAGGYFGPATTDEANTCLQHATSIPEADKVNLDQFGLVSLGTTGHYGPRYDICTVDPSLATESDVGRRKEALAQAKAKDAQDQATAMKNLQDAAQSADSSKDQPRNQAAGAAARTIQTLRSGGLRLLDRDRLLAACEQYITDAKQNEAIKSCIAANAPILQDAVVLGAGTRLLVGLKSSSGELEWRCPQYRTVTYQDPTPPKGDMNWVEHEIERRLGKPDGERRLELDAATLNPLDQIHVEPQPGPRNDLNDIEDKIVTLITNSTVAAWGGEPMGLPPTCPQKKGPSHPQEIATRIAATGELSVSRGFAATSAAKGSPSDVLNPRLRFGWPYHLALSRVVQGGVAPTRAEAAQRLKTLPRFALPALKLDGLQAEGRRFLRHERIDAPMLVFLDKHLEELKGIKPTQLGTSLVVRSSADPAYARPRLTSRLLVAPPMPMHFVALHGVFDDLDPNERRPPEGLRGFSRPDVKKKDTPQHVRVASSRPDQPDPELRYYPDPAANSLVLALRRPESAGEVGWLGEPLVVPVGGKKWPELMPVQIELQAVEKGNKDTLLLVDDGERKLGGAGSVSGGPAVRVVRCLLQPGEDVELRAWFVPTVGQLANWFDAVEAAALLATHEGDPTSRLENGNACARGLQALIKKQVDGKQSDDDAAKKVCTSAGNLAIPSSETMRAFATLVYQTLLRRPIPALGAPLTMRLTHASDEQFVSIPSIIPSSLAVARRKFAGGDGIGAPGKETRLDFINTLRSSDWDARCSEESAVGGLFAGRLKIDLATTSAVELEIECAAPDSDLLDDATRGRSQKMIRSDMWPQNLVEGDDKLFGFRVGRDHQVRFPRRRVMVLRIDGLPLPEDCKAGLRDHLTLEQLQAASWGEAKSLGQALRSSLSVTLTSSGARHLKVRPVAIGRHAGLMPASPQLKPKLRTPADGTLSKDAEHGVRGDFVEVWLPSTARPAPPVVDRIQAGFYEPPIKRLEGQPGTFTLRYERTTSYRIWLRRPWASSGEGEKLGLVLWPPGLFSRGVGRDDSGTVIPAVELLDGDLGAGGQYVSRWGADPIMRGEAPAGPFIEPQALDAKGEAIPRAYMPVPIEGPWSSPDEGKSTKQTAAVGDQTTTQPQATPAGGQASTQPQAGQPGVPNATPTEYLAVGLQTFSPLFDPLEELWYVDLSLRTDPYPMPRVRLGLVRYQPHAREDDISPDGEPPTRLRVSTPIAEWVQPLPGRVVEVTCHPTKSGANPQTKIYVTVKGPFHNPDQQGDTTTNVDTASTFTGTRPALEIELLRHRALSSMSPAAEEPATDVSNLPCRWQTWKPGGPGIANKIEGGWAWTCFFILPGVLNHSDWQHAITVREVIRGKRANQESKDHRIGGLEPLESGPKFFARIELE